MKTIKRVMAGMMVATMMLATVMSVSAANSKGEAVYPAEPNSGYEVAPENKEFNDVKEEVLAVIDKVDKNDFSGLDKNIQKALTGKKALAPMIDLEPIGDHSSTCKDGHKITLKVDSLTSKCTEVIVLHYSTVRGIWETIQPTKVDYTAKTVSFTLQDMSPIMILAKGVDSGSTGTSPSTEGMNYNWMLWVAVAFVAAGAGVVATQKKNR